MVLPLGSFIDRVKKGEKGVKSTVDFRFLGIKEFAFKTLSIRQMAGLIGKVLDEEGVKSAVDFF